MTFDLEAFKASYEPSDAFMAKFWETYDKENWSIWRCVYDYADDNEDLAATKEIVTEFMKKSAGMESECFGVMHVCGNLEIEGLWLFKGEDPENMFGKNEDTSWFSWNQLGPDASDAVKAAIADIWAATSTVGGKEIKDTQVFNAPASSTAEVADLAEAVSSFDLAAFKSAYEPSDAAMAKFWETYDKENWSIWRCVYDYADDNEDLAATKEIVTEFMKKSAGMESECFGVMHVCGNLEIEGLWLFKGEDPENMFGKNEDTSWFSWNQLGPDASDPVKAAIADIWAATSTVGGKEVQDTQVFK